MPATPQQIIKEIQELYLSDSLPWIIGYSGGKDSTASLQLIWLALASLPEERRRFKPVHVISTDTLVENPIIAAWVELSLAHMEVSAIKQGLPIKPHRLTPTVENRFWVNLIGKGYPAPRNKFRWCTDRLKISASTKFIQDLSEANGEAILVLGQRRGESQVRDKVMDTYQHSTRERLSRNKDPKLSRVWVYLPIETWSSDDVWEYIIQTPNPWGINNQDLFDIYRGATPDSECPIVVDKSTPSCGDSRFGCYVCTMVSQDKSMAAMIQNDADKAWMQPIMDFRDKFLASGGEEGDRKHRDFRRLNGRLTVMRDRLVHGPYSQERRRVLLLELLKAQRAAMEGGQSKGYGQIELISIEELDEIRRIWVEDKGEIEDYLPSIYQEATGHPYPGRELDPMPLEPSDLILLKRVAGHWSMRNQPSDEPAVRRERRLELYKLLRTLLATSFRGLQSRQRSKQLDEISALLKAFAFVDEADALAFALVHHPEKRGDNSGAGPADEQDNELLTEDLEGDSTRKVIPIALTNELLV
ncbi:DNA sulfur modification protein DndC [Acidovorax delafieldii]|uniref:DNA sulfur modification protein DndC n=1 Tax=Acidovorax delafieldii TaxID=47920 RepID=A0AAJ2F096_ACIDE|nr:DNA phosphorothioation system sulfurtransferase DndC [Acidovorax delafieldii]MDR6766486.1 DNA sulfur modification protein DndC [Acidovorax delafieldii]MDR6836576.1 DNA sulfur modification protein DndC [Acidovorax delafieldii]MDR7366067.1 DNA sulfur modification protein DndC [Acidovorax delafieldii]